MRALWSFVRRLALGIVSFAAVTTAFCFALVIAISGPPSESDFENLNTASLLALHDFCARLPVNMRLDVCAPKAPAEEQDVQNVPPPASSPATTVLASPQAPAPTPQSDVAPPPLAGGDDHTARDLPPHARRASAEPHRAARRRAHARAPPRARHARAERRRTQIATDRRRVPVRTAPFRAEPAPPPPEALPEALPEAPPEAPPQAPHELEAATTPVVAPPEADVQPVNAEPAPRAPEDDGGEDRTPHERSNGHDNRDHNDEEEDRPEQQGAPTW